VANPILPDSVLLDTCAAIWLMAANQSRKRAGRLFAAPARPMLGLRFALYGMGDWHTNRQATAATHTFSRDMVWEAAVSAWRAAGGINANDSACLHRTARIAACRSGRSHHRGHSRVQGHIVITRDKKLLDYAREGHIRAIAC